MDNDDRVIGVISLSDILKELVLKPSRNIILQLKKKKKNFFSTINLFFLLIFSFKEKYFQFGYREYRNDPRGDGHR